MTATFVTIVKKTVVVQVVVMGFVDIVLLGLTFLKESSFANSD